MSAGSLPIYAFGPFVLDPAERRLTRAGRRVPVPRKAWQILLMLAEAGGRLVPHESFRSRLWPSVVVEDRTLTVHMSTLRKALEDGSPMAVIETVPREGYRLAVPVRVLDEADSAARAAEGRQVEATSTLAVRPFATSDLGEAEVYLGVGIADAVGTVLGTVSGLVVPPVDAAQDLASARLLGAEHMLEGSVHRSAERLVVSAALR